MKKRGIVHLALIVGVVVVVAAVAIIVANGGFSNQGRAVYGTEEPYACTDSDANDRFPDGINFEEGGDIRLRKTWFRDHCEGNTLTEYYCQNGQIADIEQVCENGCNPGFGRCN